MYKSKLLKYTWQLVTKRSDSKSFLEEQFKFGELNSWYTHLCSIRGPLKVTGHKEVDDGSADALCGQDEGQGPPETQHLFDSGIALQESKRIPIQHTFKRANLIHYSIISWGGIASCIKQQWRSITFCHVIFLKKALTKPVLQKRKKRQHLPPHRVHWSLGCCRGCYSSNPGRRYWNGPRHPYTGKGSEWVKAPHIQGYCGGEWPRTQSAGKNIHD